MLLKESAFGWRTAISRGGTSTLSRSSSSKLKTQLKTESNIEQDKSPKSPKYNLAKIQITIKEKYGQIISIHSKFAMCK